jgi:S-adenosyl methyltransferase
MLIAILHLIDDDAEPRHSVAKLIEAVPSGSYLAISHLSSDIMANSADEAKSPTALWGGVARKG